MYVKRREEILAALKDSPTLSVRSLSDRLSVSEMTVRRDLAKLETEGVIQRYFGGVRTTDLPLLQQATNVRASSMTQAKRRIAEKVCRKYNAVTVCTGGFHFDGITPAQIREVVSAVEGDLTPIV